MIPSNALGRCGSRSSIFSQAKKLSVFGGGTQTSLIDGFVQLRRESKQVSALHGGGLFK
jgi:hypothetical protein